MAKWVYQIGQRTATITTITNKGIDFKKTQDLIHNKIKLANQIADSGILMLNSKDRRCNGSGSPTKILGTRMKNQNGHHMILKLMPWLKKPFRNQRKPSSYLKNPGESTLSMWKRCISTRKVITNYKEGLKETKIDLVMILVNLSGI